MAGTIESLEKMFFLMQNILTIPAFQHGCSAKPQKQTIKEHVLKEHVFYNTDYTKLENNKTKLFKMDKT